MLYFHYMQGRGWRKRYRSISFSCHGNPTIECMNSVEYYDLSGYHTIQLTRVNLQFLHNKIENFIERDIKNENLFGSIELDTSVI